VTKDEDDRSAALVFCGSFTPMTVAAEACRGDLKAPETFLAQNPEARQRGLVHTETP